MAVYTEPQVGIAAVLVLLVRCATLYEAGRNAKPQVSMGM
jgi:hypothetical protein